MESDLVLSQLPPNPSPGQALLQTMNQAEGAEGERPEPKKNGARSPDRATV